MFSFFYHNSISKFIRKYSFFIIKKKDYQLICLFIIELNTIKLEKNLAMKNNGARMQSILIRILRLHEKLCNKTMQQNLCRKVGFIGFIQRNC